jgi:hypothetical protein
VKQGLADFIGRTDADELMITSNMFDPAARRRSFAIVAEARDALAAEGAEAEAGAGAAA